MNNSEQQTKKYCPGKRMNKIFFKSLFTFAILSALTFAQERDVAKMEALADTVFKTMSTDELIRIQETYRKQVEKLRNEEEKIRGRGLEVTESFLKSEGMDIKDQDKILIRVAEYYIEDADDAYSRAFEEYIKADEEYAEQLELFDEGKLEVEPEPPKEPVMDYSKAIEIYDQILSEFPQSDFADDALYSKAYLLEQMKQGKVARRIYQEVIDKYPDSHFAAESYMRLAEYFFAPREGKDTEQSIVELQKAIKLYKKVLKYKDSKRYDEALYKLGWSYYKLSATDPDYYSDAIVYFLAVIDDIERANKMDPKDKISNPNVRDEAIQYIGISFSDEDTYAHAGVSNARKFIEKLGNREYGVEIMRALGETYQRVENYEKAINAYQNLLDMYPYYKEAPIVKRKISETYFDMGEDDLEYNTRYEIFRDYNPNSEWYAALEKSEIPNKVKYLTEAREISEKAMYTNIFLDIERAQELESDGLPATDAWNKVVNNCEEYMQVFPADSNTYDINWSYAYVLDVHLGKFKESFDQYIKVSNDYLEKEHQEEAANNAIVVAETLATVANAALRDTSAVIDISDAGQLNPEMMTAEEKRLVEAYNNYIRLFPDNEKTPIFLAKAGAIYFNRKQFAEAKVYFNTLVSRFPGAKQKSIAMRSIMNSYFALGKFRDSEFIAKKILGSVDLPDEEKIFAEQRLAQSIFKNAKLLEEQGQFFEAANEYRRVYAEAPENKELVEPALFNSGLMYDKIQEWEKALDTYLLLADAFPKSNIALDALNNAAEDYKELKQFDSVGKVYERIYASYKDNKEVAEPALYNASYYYEKGEAWEDAIRANNLYIAAYPDETLAIDLYFANAGHYLKLDNVAESNRIYEEFAARFPDDPKAVEAFYRRGSYFREHGKFSAAKVEFDKAIRKSEEFARKGLDPNRYYAGESLNELVAMLYDEFDAIELKQPESNILAAQNNMRDLVRQIISNNTKIIANGSIRSFEATFRNAEIYEEFADKFVNQERDPNMDPIKQFAESRRINSQAAQLYEKAVDEYKKVINNIPIIAEKFDVDIFAEAVPDTVGQFQDTSDVVKRVVETDSTREVAKRWYAKAQDKISSLLYTEAQLTMENVKQAINAENPATDPLTRLIFQVRLINDGVAPAVTQTINAHKRNIAEAKELGLSNKYVEESKRQILLTSNILANELEKLTFLAIDPYEKMAEDIIDLIDKEWGAKNEQGLDYPTIHNNAMQMIDLSRDLALATMNNYANSLNLAQEEGLNNDIVRTTKDRMMRLPIELTDLYESYSDSAEERTKRYAALFDSTENYNYDDGSAYFLDHQLAFDDYELIVLEEAYQHKENFQINNLWTTRLGMKLFKIDPARYATSVKRDTIEIMSVDDWLFSDVYVRGYVDSSFDDSNWTKTSEVESKYNQFLEFGFNPPAMWKAKPKPVTAVSGSDSLLQDSLAVSTDTSAAAGDSLLMAVDSLSVPDTTALAATDSVAGDTVTLYFRKKVNLTGTPVGGMIYITADNDFRFFINGEYIIDDELNNFAVVDTIDYETISYYLKSGENTFAIEAVDWDNSGGGVKIAGYIEVLPTDIMDKIASGAQTSGLNVDPAELKKVNILNKNRISVQD